jgi:hypothetical protein
MRKIGTKPLKKGHVPTKIWLYRIVHYQNVDYLLRHGMSTRQRPNHDPNYINIGDNTLIQQRDDYPVALPNHGNLGDYVPFYFGALSPMLLNIKTGHRGVAKYLQSDIVYIVSSLEHIKAANCRWVFSDGHAKRFYNDEADLDKVDWPMVKERYWQNTQEDFDRMRRKQAEFLVWQHVPASCIHTFVVFDEAKQLLIQKDYQ